MNTNECKETEPLVSIPFVFIRVHSWSNFLIDFFDDEPRIKLRHGY
jgi:hypothetical protein